MKARLGGASGFSLQNVQRPWRGYIATGLNVVTPWNTEVPIVGHLFSVNEGALTAAVRDAWISDLREARGEGEGRIEAQLPLLSDLEATRVFEDVMVGYATYYSVKSLMAITANAGESSGVLSTAGAVFKPARLGTVMAELARTLSYVPFPSSIEQWIRFACQPFSRMSSPGSSEEYNCGLYKGVAMAFSKVQRTLADFVKDVNDRIYRNGTSVQSLSRYKTVIKAYKLASLTESYSVMGLDASRGTFEGVLRMNEGIWVPVFVAEQGDNAKVIAVTYVSTLYKHGESDAQRLAYAGEWRPEYDVMANQTPGYVSLGDDFHMTQPYVQHDFRDPSDQAVIDRVGVPLIGRTGTNVFFMNDQCLFQPLSAAGPLSIVRLASELGETWLTSPWSSMSMNDAGEMTEHNPPSEFWDKNFARVYIGSSQTTIDVMEGYSATQRLKLQIENWRLLTGLRVV